MTAKPERRAREPRLKHTRPRSEADLRGRFFARAADRTDYLTVGLPAGRLLVRTNDQHIGRALYIKGGRGDIKVLARSVLAIQGLLGHDKIAQSTFIDVGANIGSTTVSALLSHPFADALALEPEPENHLTLRLNLVLNGLEGRVTAMQLAASNVTGSLPLVVGQAQSGTHWLATEDLDPATLPKDWSPLTVPVTTLDALAEAAAYDPSRVGLVWIDAENHEAQILDGASELTSRGVPALFELDPPGLKRRGNLDLLCAIVQEHYTHFAKMRAETRAGHPRYQLRPANEIRELCTSHDHFTDVLVLRLEKRQVPTDGLSTVLRSQSNLA